jgi:hypothetical protein
VVLTSKPLRLAGGAVALVALVAGVAWIRRGSTALGVGALATAAGLGYLVLGGGRRRRRRRNPARAAGRARQAAPRAARARLSPLEREIRSCRRSALAGVRPTTFRRKEEAVGALLDVNPRLLDLVERDCGADCRAFKAWQQHGRRGPKPRAAAGDGRFDALNEQWERRTPGRKVASWVEALYVTAPSSRRWEDWRGRIEVLEDAAGFRLHLPARAEQLAIARADARRCDDIEAPSLAPF